MPSGDTKILEFNQYQNSDQAVFIIYADPECLIEKTDECKNYPEISSTTKVVEHISSGFSMSTISSVKTIESKHDKYRGKDCVKRFCESLRDHTMQIIKFKKKKMKLLTKEQQESYKNAKIYYICKEKFENKYVKDKKHCKVRDHCHYTGEHRSAVHNIYNLKYTLSKEIHTVFHNGSNYGYHLIIKKSAEKFASLGENTEQYLTLQVQ